MLALSVIIPVYNGALTIRPLVHEVAQLEIEGGLEIILVDDGSRDNSCEVIKSLVEEVAVPIIAINLARNFGEHNAVMAGFAASKGQFVINIDDDFQNPPCEVKKLYDFARSRPDLDVVYTFYDKKKHTLLRNLGSRFTNWVANFLLEKPKDLYLSSFRCSNAFVRDCVLAYQGPYPYIDGLILQATQRIGSLNVQHNLRAEGESNYTLRKLVRLWMAMFVNFSVMPLRISGMLGFTISILGLALTIYAIVEHFVSSTPAGWTSLMSVVLVFSGVQLLMLGIIGEYLGRLYMSYNARPQYFVRERYENNAHVASQHDCGVYGANKDRRGLTL